MRQFIPKIDPTLETTKIGWFFIANEKGEREVFFAVPGLEGIARLMLHEIAGHGGVEPSVMVRGVDKSGAPIEYREDVSLNDWPSGIKKPAGVQFIPPEEK